MTARAWCTHCHRRITQNVIFGKWVHILTLSPHCELHAEPEMEQ